MPRYIRSAIAFCSSAAKSVCQFLYALLRALCLRNAPEERRCVAGRLHRFACAVLVLVLMSNSVLAGPLVAQAVVSTTTITLLNHWHMLRYHAYASGWVAFIQGKLTDRPGAREIKPQEEQDERDAKIHEVLISPGDVTVQTGQPVALNAMALAQNGAVIGGVKFTWTGLEEEKKRKLTIGPSVTFSAALPGKYKVTAEAAGQKKGHIFITVAGEPHKPTDPAKVVPTVSASSRDVPQKKIGTRFRSVSGSSAQRLAARKRTRSALKGKNATALALRHSVTSLAPAVPLLPQGGGYEDPYSWNSSNYWSADDPGRERGDMPGHPADGGAGSGNFQFAAPVLGLDGRGLDLNLALNYNSRVWHKASQSATEVTYDIDRDWPAPGWTLGFGKIIYSGTTGGYMLIDGDGTRHPYQITVGPSYGGLFFAGKTTDGAFIDYQGNAYANGIPTYATAWLPDGTVIKYSAPGNSAIYPITIRDRQGNFISITYRNNQGPEIDTITDTLGRVIRFYYDSNNLLTAITAPSLGTGNPDRTLVRLHYRDFTIGSGLFSLTQMVRNSTVKLIDAIYYPATSTGYWFGDGDSFSHFGMLAKVIEQRGMGFTDLGLNYQGTVTQGAMSHQMVYEYPTSSGLSDVPTYPKSRETWAGIQSGAPFIKDTSGVHEVITEYVVNQNSTPRTTTIKRTDPLTLDEIHVMQSSYNAPGSYLDGLVYYDETKDKNGNVLKSSQVTWQQGDYSSPRPSATYITDRPGQTKRIEFSYGPSNQVTEARDYDYDGLLLRKTVTQYENSSNYTWLHIFNLVKQVDIYASDQVTRESRTVYTYDGGTLADAPGVTHHDDAYNPYAPPYENCYCNYDPGYCQWTCEWYPTYDPSTAYRGNVTSVTTYADAQNLTGAVTHNFSYDMTGNQLTASTSCCEQTSWQYGLSTQYAWPLSQKRGSATNTSHQNTGSATYDFNTGLTLTTTDANGRTTSTTYYPATLRPQYVTAPTGAFTHHVYDDAGLVVYDRVYDPQWALASGSDKYLDGLGRVHGEVAYGGPATGWYVDVVNTKFDGQGRVWQQTRPYRNGVDTPQWSVVKYDLLNRPIETTAPDNSKTYRYYDSNAPAPAGASNAKGQTVRVKDQWGRERWARYDAQERLVEVVEPNENGDGTVATGGYVTTYTYDTLGRLTGTSQGAQTRSFKYDSLGRLTHQKLAEREATLDNNGNAGSAWSDYFSYDSRSNLTLRVDARRVRTTYSYYNTTLGTEDPLNRLQSVAYDKSQALNSSLIPDAPSVAYSYETTGDKTRLNTVNVGNGAITDALLYDSESRLSQATQTFAAKSSYPLVSNYLYDTVGRIKEIQYPAEHGQGGARRIVKPTYDIASRLTSLEFGGEMYASGITYNASSQALSVSIGNANQLSETYIYDQQTGLLTEQLVQRVSPNTTHLRLKYNYTLTNDPNNSGAKSGQLTGITDLLDSTRNRAYTYDKLARVKEVKGGTNAFSAPTWWQTYSYDRYGNRGNVTMGGSPGGVQLDGVSGLTFNTATNRITNTSYEYDAAGNQTRGQVEGGVFKRFRYDAAGRLAEVRDDGDTTVQEKYTYGASSQRLMATQGSTETVYAWDGGQVVAEYSSATSSNALTWQKGYV